MKDDITKLIICCILAIIALVVTVVYFAVDGQQWAITMLFVIWSVACILFGFVMSNANMILTMYTNMKQDERVMVLNTRENSGLISQMLAMQKLQTEMQKTNLANTRVNASQHSGFQSLPSGTQLYSFEDGDVIA